MVNNLLGSPESQCWGKEPYATAALANKVAARRKRSLHARLKAYHCQHCGHWHIGTEPKSRDVNHRRRDAIREEWASCT